MTNSCWLANSESFWKLLRFLEDRLPIFPRGSRHSLVMEPLIFFDAKAHVLGTRPFELSVLWNNRKYFRSLILDDSSSCLLATWPRLSSWNKTEWIFCLEGIISPGRNHSWLRVRKIVTRLMVMQQINYTSQLDGEIFFPNVFVRFKSKNGYCFCGN